MVSVQVYVGVGSWKAHTTVSLVTEPHTGDWIVVGERLVLCERVIIGERDITVEESRRFTAPDQAESYFASGDV